MEYAPVFCGTNLLSLDELQVNGEGGGNTETILPPDICSDSDDSEVVREAYSDHLLGVYSVMCSKIRKGKCIFHAPRQIRLNFLLDLIRISSGDRKSVV